MASRRGYFDGCAAAHALDLIGERWALLIVRELMLGPKRFTDVRAGLPQASPNVLSQRLRDLENVGVVQRRRLPPPAASAVYELTDWGLELEPVLQTLGRWASRSPMMPKGAEMGLDSFVLALRTMFSAPRADGLHASYELRLGEQTFAVQVTNGQFEISRGTSVDPDATVVGAVEALTSVVFGGRPLADALQAGELSVSGDLAAVERFVTLFPLPERVAAPAALVDA
jgi:DNA-binding HxlR family transcriptional regulator